SAVTGQKPSGPLHSARKSNTDRRRRGEPTASRPSMIWPAVGCLAACLVLAVLAPRVGRVIEPALATRLLGGVSVAAAASLLWVAALAAITAVAPIPLVARLAGWAPPPPPSADPRPPGFAV